MNSLEYEQELRLILDGMLTAKSFTEIMAHNALVRRHFGNTEEQWHSLRLPMITGYLEI